MSKDRSAAQGCPRFGCDEYGRYEEIAGEKYVIEPYPFFRSPLRKLRARLDIVRWHIGRTLGR